MTTFENIVKNIFFRAQSARRRMYIVAVNDFLVLRGWEKWAHSHSFKETSNFQPLEAPPPSCPLIHAQTFYSSELGYDQNVKCSCPLLFILDNNSIKKTSRLNTYS
jgi:hypothetical protein